MSYKVVPLLVNMGFETAHLNGVGFIKIKRRKVFMKLKRWMALVLSAALLAPVLPADGAIEVQAEEPAQERTLLTAFRR